MTAFVLLHGFAQTPASWDAVALRLQTAGHRTYVPDLYKGKGDLKLSGAEGALGDVEQGEGVEGDASAEGVPAAACDPAVACGSAVACDPLASLGTACDRVAAVVRLAAQADGAPVLVGYSMGGRLAAETVVRHPDLPLAGLVLESAGLGPADEAARAALAERNGEWAARLRREGVAPFMDWWEALPLFASQRALPPEVRAAVRAERISHDAESLARSLEGWGAHCQADEAETLSALAELTNRDVPVLYLAGALDEKYAAVAGRVRAAGLPAMLVPDAGHNVHLEASAIFSKVLEAIVA